MKKIFILLILSAIFNSVSGQVAIGKTSVDNSAVLEVSNLNNKAVLLPRVDIIDVLSNTSPVVAPADGLLV